MKIVLDKQEIILYIVSKLKSIMELITKKRKPKTASYSLSQDTIKEIKKLSRKTNRTQAQIIDVAISKLKEQVEQELQNNNQTI